jgi:glycosyltransferase involved in cell wall biosynthesis
MLITGWQAYSLAKALQADIYHLHDPELLPYGLALCSGGNKVIYDAHEDVPRDIESKHWIPIGLRRPIRFLFERFENMAARRLSAVVAATAYIGKRFKQINPNTVTINNYPVGGDLHQGDALPGFSCNERPYVCYAGGISAIRGVREMITAISHTDVRMLLAGSFDSERLRNETMQLSGWGRVEFLGQVKRAELASALRRSFAGLVVFHPETNHLHAQPNKMYEYMSAGLPLVVSDFPLWRELVEGIGCGICVDPLSPQAIAEAITFLDRDRDRAKAMGERGLSAVNRKFNWEREQAGLIGLYQRLLVD